MRRRGATFRPLQLLCRSLVPGTSYSVHLLDSWQCQLQRCQRYAVQPFNMWEGLRAVPFSLLSPSFLFLSYLPACPSSDFLVDPVPRLVLPSSFFLLAPVCSSSFLMLSLLPLPSSFFHFPPGYKPELNYILATLAALAAPQLSFLLTLSSERTPSQNPLTSS